MVLETFIMHTAADMEGRSEGGISEEMRFMNVLPDNRSFVSTQATALSATITQEDLILAAAAAEAEARTIIVPSTSTQPTDDKAGDELPDLNKPFDRQEQFHAFVKSMLNGASMRSLTCFMKNTKKRCSGSNNINEEGKQVKQAKKKAVIIKYNKYSSHELLSDKYADICVAALFYVYRKRAAKNIQKFIDMIMFMEDEQSLDKVIESFTSSIESFTPSISTSAVPNSFVKSLPVPPLIYHLLYALDAINDDYFTDKILMKIKERNAEKYMEQFMDKDVATSFFRKSFYSLKPKYFQLLNTLVRNKQLSVLRNIHEVLDFFYDCKVFCDGIQITESVVRNFADRVKAIKSSEENPLKEDQIINRLHEIYVELVYRLSKKENRPIVFDYCMLIAPCVTRIYKLIKSGNIASSGSSKSIGGNLKRKRGHGDEENDEDKEKLSDPNAASTSGSSFNSDSMANIVIPTGRFPSICGQFPVRILDHVPKRLFEPSEERLIRILNQIGRYRNMDTDVIYQISKTLGELENPGKTAIDIVDKIKLVNKTKLELGSNFKHSDLEIALDTLHAFGYKSLYKLTRDRYTSDESKLFNFLKMFCNVKHGFEALVQILKDIEDERLRQRAFIFVVRETLLDKHSHGASEYLPWSVTGNILHLYTPYPSSNLVFVVDAFPQYCYIEELDFGIIRECLETGQNLKNVVALPNVAATINKKYRYYGNAPAVCMCHLSPSMLIDLVLLGADPNVTTGFGENIFHFIARSSSTVIAQALNIFPSDSAKAAIETRRPVDGATPVMVAVANNNVDVVTNMVKIFNAKMNTAFCQSRSVRTIDVFLLKGLAPSAMDSIRRYSGTVPSVSIIAKAALEGKLDYDQPGGSLPTYMQGKCFDATNYRQKPGYTKQSPYATSGPVTQNSQCLKGWVYRALGYSKNIMKLFAALKNKNVKALRELCNLSESWILKLYNDSLECTICIDHLDYNHPDSAFLECGHTFHFECIRRVTDKKCPNCRRVYTRIGNRRSFEVLVD